MANGIAHLTADEASLRESGPVQDAYCRRALYCTLLCHNKTTPPLDRSLLSLSLGRARAVAFCYMGHDDERLPWPHSRPHVREE